MNDVCNAHDNVKLDDMHVYKLITGNASDTAVESCSISIDVPDNIASVTLKLQEDASLACDSKLVFKEDNCKEECRIVSLNKHHPGVF